jgi:co-chaperonin GroES (HSP10)
MVGTITEVKPAGFNVLVEMLTTQELMNTKFEIAGNSNTGEPPQAYVLAIGPSVKVDDYGIKVGDRVLLQGHYVPVPSYGNSTRERGLVQPHDIKAILCESNIIT